MQINFPKFLTIILISSFLGLLVNYFSTRGIPLLRESKELAWGSDSLVDKIVYEDELMTDTMINNPVEKEYAPAKKENPDNEIVHKETPEKIQEEAAGETEEVITEPVKIHVDAAYKLYNKNVLFIDARPPDEFNEGHIQGAYSIPYYAEDVESLLSRIDKDQPVVVYCSGTDCDLSIMLGNKMYDMGYKKIFVFFGGWNEWVDKNYPVELPE